jgi:Putative peptidoglycan binding domain
MPFYTVNQGECISSISFDLGFAPKTIWNHPQNADLKRTRKDPNVLFPGDLVFVPEKEIRIETRPTDARHLFVRKGVPEFLSLRFLHDQEPCAGEHYMLIVDDSFGPSGELDADGACIVPIPPGSRSASLTLGDPGKGEVYRLLLGHLDPVEEISGVQWRLSNLGYFETAADGQDSPELEEAVKAFQLDHDLPAGNGLDDATRQKLKDVHGS